LPTFNFKKCLRQKLADVNNLWCVKSWEKLVLSTVYVQTCPPHMCAAATYFGKSKKSYLSLIDSIWTLRPNCALLNNWNNNWIDFLHFCTSEITAWNGKHKSANGNSSRHSTVTVNFSLSLEGFKWHRRTSSAATAWEMQWINWQAFCCLVAEL